MTILVDHVVVHSDGDFDDDVVEHSESDDDTSGFGTFGSNWHTFSQNCKT